MDYHHLLRQILNGNDTEREQALHLIYTMDEEAVSPLLDQFYAGVNEDTGLLILSLLKDIGGFEARNLFIYLVNFEPPYPSWRDLAQTALDDIGF